MQLIDLPRKRKFYVFGAVLLAMMLGALDATIVGPALPNIVRELSGIALLSWVVTIYLLTSTTVIPIVGKLSDLYGRKWFFLAAIVIFIFGSMLSGLAGSTFLTGIFSSVTGSGNAMYELILARGVQGLGGGALMGLAMAIIGDLFEPRERGHYQGFIGGVFGLASIFGPILGGWLTDAASWRWIFFINLPLGLAALLALLIVMPKPEHGRRHSIDWAGTAALITGLVPLLLALSWGGSQYPWTSSTVLTLFAIAAIALVAFGVWEFLAAEPILDLRLFKGRSFAASMTVLFLSGVGMFGAVLFLPLFMQAVQGASASVSGSLLTPMMLSIVFSSVLVGQLIARTGRYKAYGIGGMAVAATGMLLLSTLTAGTSSAFVVAAMVLLGLGIGVTMPLFTVSLQAQFPTRMGEVTAAMQFFRQIGATLGVALLGGVMNAAFAANLQALVTRDAAKFGSAAPLLDKLTADPSNLLNAGALEQITSSVPPELRSALAPFFLDVKAALASSIASTFTWAFALFALAFIAMWLVRETPIPVHADRRREIEEDMLASIVPSDAEDEAVFENPPIAP